MLGKCLVVTISAHQLIGAHACLFGCRRHVVAAFLGWVACFSWVALLLLLPGGFLVLLRGEYLFFRGDCFLQSELAPRRSVSSFPPSSSLVCTALVCLGSLVAPSCLFHPILKVGWLCIPESVLLKVELSLRVDPRRVTALVESLYEVERSASSRLVRAILIHYCVTNICQYFKPKWSTI